MTDLVLAADMSEPLPDYGILPAGVVVVLGYAGGATPHAWTAAEVAAVRRSGRAWWPIWTAANPNARLTSGQGHWDALAMVAELARLDIPTATPCFYDIEQSTYAASPTGAAAAWSMWQQTMAAYGHRRAWPYLPASANYGWQAHWTGVRPASIPAGVVGIQYEGASAHPGYDLSLFDLDRLGVVTVSSPADIWAYPIDLGAKAKDPALGYTQVSYRAEQLLSDVSWRTRDNENRLLRVQRALAALAEQPAAQVDAQAVVKALAAALADDVTT